jgi:hypothetical protein
MQEEDWKRINLLMPKEQLRGMSKGENSSSSSQQKTSKEGSMPTSYFPTVATCMNTGFHLFDASPKASQIMTTAN